MASYAVTVTDDLGLASDLTNGDSYVATLSDTAKLHDVHTLFKGVSLQLASTLRVVNTFDDRMRRAAKVSAQIKLRSPLAVNTLYNRSVKGGDLRVSGLFGFQHAAIVNQAMRFGARARIALGLTMVETLRLVQSQARSLILKAVLRQGIDLHEILGPGRGASLADAVRLADRMTRVYCAAASAREALGLADLAAITLQVVVVVRATLALDDDATLRSIFAGRLVDGLDFSLGLAEPGGGVTTWAMNIRTGAVTEYTDFAFTSFAPFGNSYLGVGRDGLYELLGDDDAGSPIVADMISGLAQMTGSQLGSFKAAYVAMRGQGEFYLRLTADENRSTTYRVVVQPLRTARVDMGKGWRARYFSFQLISSGQDFNLDGLEFLPIAATRRI